MHGSSSLTIISVSDAIGDNKRTTVVDEVDIVPHSMKLRSRTSVKNLPASTISKQDSG